MIHPASAALTPLFARWGWSPNAVSALGLLSALLAAIFFYNYQNLIMSILGFGFLLAWHVLDGADGQLARLTGKTSDFGKIIDGLCDHLGFGMVYIALGLAIQPLYGPWIWVVVIGAGVSHLVQAGALEFHRDSYDCWVHRNTAKCVPTPDQLTKNSTDSCIPLHHGHLLYIRMQHLAAMADSDLMYGEKKLRRHPDRGALGPAYKQHALRSVRRWTWLSANKRTFAVALFCIVKLPILFFLFEIVVLNGLLIWLRLQQRKTNKKLRHAVLDPHISPDGFK